MVIGLCWQAASPSPVGSSPLDLTPEGVADLGGNVSEWTASVYRNQANGPTEVEQLETVVLRGLGDVSFDRVYFAIQHAFRCVALPSN